eukprot:scaffold28362_cov65-Phaeocystis_antarctica.AAC.3
MVSPRASHAHAAEPRTGSSRPPRPPRPPCSPRPPPHPPSEGGLGVVDGLLRHALAEDERLQRLLRLRCAAEEHTFYSEGVEGRHVAAIERRPHPGRRRAHRACVQLRPAGRTSRGEPVDIEGAAVRHRIGKGGGHR